MALTEYSHHASWDQLRARAREEAGVETYNALREQKTLPPGMRPEQIPEARGRRGATAQCAAGTSRGAPLLAVQSLRGFDGVDDTAAKFLLQQALEKKKEEEEEERRLAVALEKEKHVPPSSSAVSSSRPMVVAPRVCCYARPLSSVAEGVRGVQEGVGAEEVE